MRSGLRAMGIAVLTAVAPLAQAKVEPIQIDVHYIERDVPPPPVLSNLDPVPSDLGLQGAALGVADSNTTGKFLGQTYVLSELTVAEGQNLAAAIAPVLSAKDGPALIVANLPAADLSALAAMPEANGALIFNAGAPDNALRREACHPNVLHTLPSRKMLSDALAQFLVKKQWDELFLIEGNKPGDKAYAAAIRASAKKFGLEIVADKPWPFDADMRRNAAQEVPLFTQVDDHDVLILTDEIQDYGHDLKPELFRGGPDRSGVG
ncbi:MAG: ABC transporter substrate-binding protein, partial [Pseudomonadota bacterium]